MVIEYQSSVMHSQGFPIYKINSLLTYEGEVTYIKMFKIQYRLLVRDYSRLLGNFYY